jgi:hypothetical protein
MKTKTKELPKWFNGEHYSHGDTVNNPFSGEEFYLDRTELSMYDFIKGSEFVLAMNKGYESTGKLVDEMRKGLDWFRKNNAKAYMVLLD